ncbi:isopentenyl-diphosphate Delta-isomerase [Angelakisella massiliensis]|uniref:isopentenyl-diphosphate Delta-isomerase n=1 Tax=Angelakisella massiliensis TaxID=1871018 RepID=UPI0023A79997|nr:isopentenyl-diphosphate Delta-isomerase [Angelakisella massiliensis]
MMEQKEDQLLLVDLYDNVTGYAFKSEAHRRPMLHRAFSVFLFRGEEMLLQQRAEEKYHSGGLWSNACCSHPRPGEKLEEAVRRRTMMEVGADCPMTEVFSFVYCHRFHEQLYEYEFDHVFVGEYDGPLRAEPTEVAQLRWVPIPQLEQELLTHPEQFSVWFLTAAPKMLALRREQGRNGEQTGKETD